MPVYPGDRPTGGAALPNSYYDNIAQQALANPARGGVLRASQAAKAAGTPLQPKTTWDQYYQTLASNSPGFTGDYRDVLAHTGGRSANEYPGGGVSLGNLAGGGGRGVSSLPPGATPMSASSPIAQGLLNAGTPATGGVNGTPGYGGNFDINSWKDPGYDFRVGEGAKLLQGNAAARGGLLSGATLKDLTNYGQGAASQEYQNAFNRFTGNRQFNYGVDTGDRAFDYLTRTGDRDYNLGLVDRLTSAGQYGTSGAAGTNNLLATLLSGNTLAGGNANAASTIGGSNAISGGVQQAIANMLGQNLINRYAPQGG